VAAQMGHFFPDGQNGLRDCVVRDLDETLDRVQTCVNAVRLWTENEFDYLHSSQYCTFLYYLSNTAWRNRQDQRLCTKLFLLNKALNGFDCFYNNVLPDKFFIGHSVGIVLARTTFSNYLVLYQNSTVGKNHGEAPVLGEGVVLYPNSAIIGRCNIGPSTVIAQGCSIINQDTPGDCYVFSNDGELTFKKPKRNVLADIFRL
jgi:serine O-acetyltransferase